MVLSVSARAHHGRNPTLQSEMAPRKTKKGPIWPFPFTRLQAKLKHSILKAIPSLLLKLSTKEKKSIQPFALPVLIL